MNLKRIILITVLFAIIFGSIAPVFASPVYQAPGDVDGCEGAGVFYGVCKIVEGIYNFLISILNGIINGIIKIGEATIGALIAIVGGIWQVIRWLLEGFVALLGFFGHLIIAVVNAILSLIGGLLNIIFMVISTAITFILAVIQNIISVIEIVRLVAEIVIQIAGVVIGWFVQAIGIFFGIINTMNGAPATAVPGLPRCISAPMESQICALWYMVDWTIIADGTPGAYLIPLIVLMIDLLIIVYVVQSIFRLVKWFQSIFEVT